MKELLLEAMRENRSQILERLKNESENLDSFEIDKLLDALLELEKIIESLINS
jgi:hypothetical protein